MKDKRFSCLEQVVKSTLPEFRHAQPEIRWDSLWAAKPLRRLLSDASDPDLFAVELLLLVGAANIVLADKPGAIEQWPESTRAFPTKSDIHCLAAYAHARLLSRPAVTGEETAGLSGLEDAWRRLAKEVGLKAEVLDHMLAALREDATKLRDVKGIVDCARDVLQEALKLARDRVCRGYECAKKELQNIKADRFQLTVATAIAVLGDETVTDAVAAGLGLPPPFVAITLHVVAALATLELDEICTKGLPSVPWTG